MSQKLSGLCLDSLLTPTTSSRILAEGLVANFVAVLDYRLGERSSSLIPSETANWLNGAWYQWRD